MGLHLKFMARFMEKPSFLQPLVIKVLFFFLQLFTCNYGQYLLWKTRFAVSPSRKFSEASYVILYLLLFYQASRLPIVYISK